MFQKNYYDRVSSITNWKTNILGLSTVITLGLALLDKYQSGEANLLSKDYLDTVIAINSILIVLYVVFDNRAAYIYSKAEKLRRLQYLDNSFDTDFAGQRLNGYFSQSNLNAGFYKMAVNCFENAFHTFNVIYSMQFKTYIKALIVLIIFIFSAAVGERGIVRALIEAVLPLTLLQEALRTAIFINKLENIIDGFKVFFNNVKDGTFENREPEAMKYVIDYETTLAWASMPSDKDIFNEKKIALAAEWDEIKKVYKIQNS